MLSPFVCFVSLSLFVCLLFLVCFVSLSYFVVSRLPCDNPCMLFEYVSFVVFTNVKRLHDHHDADEADDDDVMVMMMMMRC